jgi:PadR family transcriptional regulator PadR
VSPPNGGLSSFISANKLIYNEVGRLEWLGPVISSTGALSTKGRNKPAARRGRAEAARRAAAEATHAADGPLPRTEKTGFEPKGRPSDVFGGELPLRGDNGAAGPRRRDIFSMLVLHLIACSHNGACYGNQLIEQIETVTRGVVSLNPNTMYPLLRELETHGFVSGHWEHPEKRSRRLYRITPEGSSEYERLMVAIEPFLDSIVESITLIKREVYGGDRPAAKAGKSAERGRAGRKK